MGNIPQTSTPRQVFRRRSRRMVRGYTRLPNTVLLDCRLTSDARFVYALLAYHARPGKEECWPGQERLAQLCKWWTRKGRPNRWRVQRALDELEEAGLIGRARGGTRRSNTYFLNPVPEELSALELEVEGQMVESLPAVMRNSQRKVQRKSASAQCASGARRSEADFQHENGVSLRNGAQHEIADQGWNLPQFSAPSCAQRIYSSLRGEGSSSSVDAVNEDFEVQNYGVCAAIELKESDCQADGSHASKLGDGRGRCLHCGWQGRAEELLPRRFESESRLTLLCPDCRWLAGVAVEVV